MIGAGEDDVYEVYKDLMRNESMTSPFKLNTKPRTLNKKLSFTERIGFTGGIGFCTILT
jgi:hypothetical protein